MAKELVINSLYKYSALVLAPKLSCVDKLYLKHISHWTGFRLGTITSRVQQQLAPQTIYISGISIRGIVHGCKKVKYEAIMSTALRVIHFHYVFFFFFF